MKPARHARQKLLQNQLHHQHQLHIKKSPRNKQIRFSEIAGASDAAPDGAEGN